MVVYYSRVRLRRFLCDQYRPARLAHYFGSISSESKRSRFLFGLVIGLGVQYSGNVYILQNSEGVHVEGTEIYLDGENLGNPAGAFWFYAIVALAAIIWGYFYVPETKGVTLEKIEEYWRKGGKPRHLR